GVVGEIAVERQGVEAGERLVEPTARDALGARGEVVEGGSGAAGPAEHLSDWRDRPGAALHRLVVQLERRLRDPPARVGLDHRVQLARELGRRADGRVRIAARHPAGAVEGVLLRLERLLPDALEEIGGVARHLALAARPVLVEVVGDDRRVEVRSEEARDDAERRGARRGIGRGGARVSEGGKLLRRLQTLAGVTLLGLRSVLRDLAADVVGEAGLRGLRLGRDAQPEDDAAAGVLDAVEDGAVLALGDALAELVHVVDARLLVLAQPGEPRTRGEHGDDQTGRDTGYAPAHLDPPPTRDT